MLLASSSEASKLREMTLGQVQLPTGLEHMTSRSADTVGQTAMIIIHDHQKYDWLQLGFL